MIAAIYHKGKELQIDLSRPLDISIPLRVGPNNVNAWWAKPVTAEPVRMGDFVGSVREGGSVNFTDVQFNPHGNGTHTECVGHISKERFTINECLRQFWFDAELISIYPDEENNDLVIQKDQLESLLKGKNPQAVVIRTLPNDFFKMRHQYSGTNPTYIHHEAISYLVELGVQHLLVDTPSIDRESDEGKLLGHRAFWQYPDDIREECTITELIYVPSFIPDGTYMLNLQIASFELDASPSKPVLYRLV